LSTRYASASLRMFQRRKWKASLRAGYTSNIASLMLSQIVGGLGGNGSIAPDASVLQPFQHTISYLNINGLTSVDLPHGLGLYGSADRSAVLTASDSGLSSRYLTTGGGVTYTKQFPWGSLSGQYGRTFGSGSVTGQTGRIEGQNYVVAVQHGNRERVQFDFSVRGSDQSVQNERPASDRSFATDESMGLHLFGAFRAQIGGGWQQSTFTTASNDFHTNGYTAHAGIEHPRFQLNGSLNSSIGNALQAYGQMFGGIGAGSALLTSVHLIPSDLRGVTLAFRANPLRKLEFSALWTRSIQHMEGKLANDFGILDLQATFHFRKIEVIAGSFLSAQIYSSYLATYPETQRGRYYIRISRTARLL
jgi:hypothetical protein